jgi:hypothetical protein
MQASQKIWNCTQWLPSFVLQRCIRRSYRRNNLHLIFCLADHFEPAILPGRGGERAGRDVQEARLELWCREIPKGLGEWRDAEGFPFRHTYFYPAEQYEASLVDRIAQHCHGGWGEMEIHLHHGSPEPDTAENTKSTLLEFREALASHGCLSQLSGHGKPLYAFVHGNFALANSARNRFCGVDSEIQILSDTGCFADFTLPSAPNVSQTAKINSLYECALPLDRRAAHRKGKDLRAGHAPQIFPLIVQGPLMWDFARRKSGVPVPVIENGEVASLHPPTMHRLRLWRKAAISVKGRPEWLFIKLHCHGMDPRDAETMHGAAMRLFLQQLTEEARAGEYRVHFTTAREMANIILAACDGKNGNPGDFRDYRLTRIRRTPEQTDRSNRVVNVGTDRGA